MNAVRMFVLFALSLQAADWLNEGGDAHRRNFQPLERELTPASVPNLKLTWKLKLGHKANLSSPVILGRLITYRGTVELVFVSSSDGHVYAVDADFGKVFWTRALESEAPRCTVPATPALTPNPPDVDPDSDDPQPPRPLYVLGADAMLHALDPIDGKDHAAPRQASCAPSLVVRNAKPVPAKAAPAVAHWKDAHGLSHTFPNAVVAGGVAFVLSKTTGELQAFDALTKRRLYKSGPTSSAASALAVANGHVCFTASDATLYCFGFPVER